MNESILQRPYTSILNMIQKAAKHIPEKVCAFLLNICSFAISCYFPVRYSIGHHRFFNNSQRSLLYLIVMTVIMVCCAGKRKKKIYRINTRFMMYIILFAAAIINAWRLHPIGNGFVQFAFFLLILFPLLSFSLFESEYLDFIFYGLAISLCSISILFYIVSAVCHPYIKEWFPAGYTGLTINANYLGMIYLCSSASALFLLTAGKRIRLSASAAGIGVCMIWFSESRAAIIAELLLLLGYIVGNSIHFGKEERRIRFKSIVMIMVLSFLISMFGMLLLTKGLGYKGIGSVQEYTDSDFKMTMYEAEESEKQSERSGSPLKKGSENISFTAIYSAEVSVLNAGRYVGIRLPDYDTLNNLSTKRLDLYRSVIRDINLTGHDVKQRGFYDIWGRKYSGAHNSPLDFTYRCGWPAGFLCLLIEIEALIFALRVLLSKKETRSSLYFSVYIIMVYIIESMIEIQTIPSKRDVTMLFYFAVMPVIIKYNDIVSTGECTLH